VFPLVVGSCLEEGGYFPYQDPPGNVQVVCGLKDLGKVVPDDEFVSLVLGPGPGGHDVDRSF